MDEEKGRYDTYNGCRKGTKRDIKWMQKTDDKRLKLNVEKSKLGGNVNVFGGRKFKIKSGNQNDVRKILKKILNLPKF